MSVVSSRELPRVWEKEIGKAGSPVRRFVVTLSDDTLQGNATANSSVLQQLGLNNMLGSVQHPEYLNYRTRKVRLEEGFEGNPYQALVTVEYGLVSDAELDFPFNRPAKWGSEASTLEVPALFYYEGSGNGTKRALTNSALDFFQGLTTSEPIVRLTYQKNFSANGYMGSGYPWACVLSVNHLNNGTWGTNLIHTCRVESASVAYVEEEFSNAIFQLWQLTASIAIRQSTWNLQLPDVGFNTIVGGQKQRAMVFDFQNAEWVPSPQPVGLDGSGGQTNGQPAVLNRRVNPEANFTALFGTPPA